MKIEDIDTNFLWGAFLMLVITALILLGVVAIAKDHPVTRYYAATGGEQYNCKWIPEENRTVCNTPVCIWADISWATDAKVYCGSDADNVIEQLKRLNETVR